MGKDYWVYILLCDNQNYYTGYTDNLTKRYQAHCKGIGGKYTRSFRPLKIAQCWRVKDNRSLAMQLERIIKKCTKPQKLQFILYPETLSQEPCVVPENLT